LAQSQGKYLHISYIKTLTDQCKRLLFTIYRTIVTEEAADSKYYDSRNLREIGIKSRLDSSANKTRTMGVLSRPKASSSSSTQSNGYRIVVSNLQANVTQEDIKV